MAIYFSIDRENLCQAAQGVSESLMGAQPEASAYPVGPFSALPGSGTSVLGSVWWRWQPQRAGRAVRGDARHHAVPVKHLPLAQLS